MPMFTRTRIVAGSIGAAVVLLGMNACTDRREPALPEGLQTMTGTLIPVPLSLDRRGSHLVRIDGKNIYYAESSSLNLHEFERMEIGLTGTLERNTDPDALPVLVITGVNQKSVSMREWNLSKPLQIRLSVPHTWDMRESDGTTSFVFSGSSMRILTIAPSTLTKLPAGTSTNVGGMRAVRTVSETGSIVYVQNNRTIVTLLFSPLSDDPEEVNAFELVLKTISFGRSSSSSSSQRTGTGTSVGIPCGGPAGILCPPRQYCEVTDTETGIGVCKKLR